MGLDKSFDDLFVKSSLTDPTGETHTGTLWSGTAPNARTERTTTQTISNATWEQVTVDTANFDSDGMFDSGTSSLSVPSAGVYYVYGVAQYSSPPDGTRLILEGAINGSRDFALAGSTHTGVAQSARASFSGLVDLASGDTITMDTWQNSGGSVDITANTAYLGVVQVDGGGTGGTGTVAADLIGSPNLNIQYSELSSSTAIKQPVSMADGETLTIYAWGVRDTDGNTPSGLEVRLVDNSGTIQASANTAWTENTNGVTSWTNTSGGRVDAKLSVYNGTGTAYTDPDGVGAQFGYEVN